jgi:poly(3-hydroxybutyrate) depolymerase
VGYRPVAGQRRPEIGLDRVAIGGRVVRVRERSVLERPFCHLVHLERETERGDPVVLVVTPLSGHFSVLLRDFLAALLPEHDLFLTDWVDAREVEPGEGAFGIGDNIGYVLNFLRHLGSDVHIIALCQSAMPALAATAVIASSEGEIAPRTLTLFNGMLDTRIARTRIDRLVQRYPLAWFERHAIARVPVPFPGQGRAVYPAEFQRAALFAYLGRHIATGGELLGKLLNDDSEDPKGHPFFEAFFSVMDLPAEFFLETIRLVFHDAALARGWLAWRGSRVDLSAIARTALMTIEGEYDDVSGPGQTRVAHELCANIPEPLRAHYVQQGVGHLGTFHGRIWREAVAPRIRSFIRGVGLPAR